jgi:WD40 repeat protein
MSPEQASGHKGVGPASDVYSLGAILYELLTGKPPFRGETALTTLTLVSEQDPLPPRLLNPAVDRDLETICLKCLEKDPERRYASAEHLAEDLRRYLQGEPIAARRLRAIGRTIKWCRRKPALAGLIAVSVLAVVGLIAVQWQVAQEERALRQIAVQREREALIRQEALRHLLYLGHVRQTQHALEVADLDRAEKLLHQWSTPKGPSDLRGWEWFFLKEQCRGPFTLSGHAGRATAVAYQPGGRRLASAGGEPGKPGEIKIWDTATGNVLQILRGHANLVTAIAYSADGRFLASASFDRTLKLWDAEHGTELSTFLGHQAQVTSVSFHPSGHWLASGSADRTLRVWRVPSAGSLVKEASFVLQGHAKEVSAVAYSPTGALLASAGFDHQVKLWHPEQGKLLHNLSGHEGEVHSLAFSVGGKVLASGGGRGSRRGEVRFWDPANGKLLSSRFGLSDRILTLGFSRDGKVAAGASDGTVRLWDQAASSEAASFHGDSQIVFGLAFSPDGVHLATAGRNGRVRIWNSSGGQETLSLTALGPVAAVACSPDGSRLAFSTRTLSRAGEIEVWSLDPLRRVATLKGHHDTVHALAFSPSGRRLASAGEDRTVRVHDLGPSKRAPMILQGHGGPVKTVAFRPDGVQIASGSADDTIRLWDAQTGSLEKVLAGSNEILTLAYSPDSRLLASGSYDKHVRVWDLLAGTSFTLTGHTGSTNAVAFSPDGTKLISASSDKTIREWDLATHSDKKLEGSPGHVLALAFHPHSRRLASAGQDKSLRLWDMVTRQEIIELVGPTGPLQSIAFSGDGRRLVCAGPGNVVRIWDAGPAASAPRE